MRHFGPALLLAALLLAMAARTAAAGAQPWTCDDMIARKSVTDPSMSPDGQWIAYVVSELNADKSEYQTDIWMVPTAGGAARRLTSSNVLGEYPRWSPDGKWIAFLSERPQP